MSSKVSKNMDQSTKYNKKSRDKKHYFYYLIIILVFIVFIFNRILAIWIGFIFIIIVFASYFPSLSFKNRLVKYMKKHKTIDDRSLADKFKRPVEEVQEQMENLTKKYNKTGGIISSLDNRCVYYNKEVVGKIIELYNRGMNEKRIFEKLKKDIQIRTRAEIKAIEDILINQKRIKKRSNRVK